MKGDPIIVASDIDPASGAIVETHQYHDRLGGWLPKYYYVARWPHSGPFDKGHGHSPAAALRDLIHQRKAA